MITQEQINEKLANAQENGYWCDETLADVKVSDIVDDLQNLDVDCEDETLEVLTPLVQTWYDAHRLIGDSQAGKASDC